MLRSCLYLLLCGWVCLLPNVSFGQVIIIQNPEYYRRLPPPRPPITVPVPLPTPSLSYRVEQVDFEGRVRDQVATIQISQQFRNTGSQTLEAQLVFPVLDSAAISGLTLIVDGKELTGRLMPKEEARRIYENIVRQQRDPALLEYLGQGLYQTSVFPIPAGATRKVEIRYTQLLKKDNGLIDLVLPLGTMRQQQSSIQTLNVALHLETTEPIKTIYSPTHAVEITRADDRHAVIKTTLRDVARPDDIRLLYGVQSGPVGLNLISYRPKNSQDGYFVLLASPDFQPQNPAPVPRTLLFVFDRSGSMSGEKINQAKGALKFLIQQLQPTDLFSIIAYDSAVESFRPELQKGDNDSKQAAMSFADGLFAGGSTNIDGALKTGLKMLHDSGRPTYVLFMTDGLPTVGEMNELKIAAAAREANTVRARLFSFGVGYDLNARLLDRLSADHRGQSISVKPNESIEAHVASLYQKIGAPMLTDISLNFEFDRPNEPGTAGPISRTYPRQLTDLYRGEQLVYVGRYKAGGMAKVSLTGKVAGEQKSFIFPAQFVDQSADDSNGFVEKLWAQRRIGEIIDELDLRGQNQELINELVQLSLQHGILTPYTSFLADETTRLGDRVTQVERARVLSEGLNRESGESGVAQRDFKRGLQLGTVPRLATPSAARSVSGPATAGGAPAPARFNEDKLEAGATLERRAADGRIQKRMIVQDAEGKLKEVDTVRQIGSKTFYRRSKQWLDSAVKEEQAAQAKKIVQYSPEYFALVEKHGRAVAKYLDFTEPVLVQLGDDLYEIQPQPEEN